MSGKYRKYSSTEFPQFIVRPGGFYGILTVTAPMKSTDSMQVILETDSHLAPKMSPGRTN